MDSDRVIEMLLRCRGKYIVYVSETAEVDTKAQRDISNLGTLYLSDMPSNRVYGDDWDDNPASANAGAPYSEFVSSTLEMERNTKIFTREEVIEILRDAIALLKEVG